MSTPILELRGIDASYGRIQVLRDVDLAVPTGGVVALLGPNGAGKSTTLKVAAGLLQPDAGDILVGGVRINGASPDELSRKGVCTVPEGRSVFPNLTVKENLALSAFACGKSERELREIAYERFPRLEERREQYAGHLSGGEQQMLAMARALATDPALLLLDELSMGLAPLIVEELYEVVGQLARDGMSVLLVEQFARTALRVADYAAVMTNGRVQAVGEPADVEEEISVAYLGGAA